MHESEQRLNEYFALHNNPDPAILRTFAAPEREQLWDFMKAHGPVDRYLELGSNCGASLWMMAPFVNQFCLSVDLCKGQSGQTEMLIKTVGAVCEGDRYALAYKSSTTDARHRIGALDKFDCVMIDADHSYEGVKADWENYRGMVKSGGLVIFHDTLAKSMGVHRLWEEINYNFSEAWLIGHKQGIGIGVMP